jgi:hypothetical protein
MTSSFTISQPTLSESPVEFFFAESNESPMEMRNGYSLS